jgi:hypothetical protein
MDLNGKANIISAELMEKICKSASNKHLLSVDGSNIYERALEKPRDKPKEIECFLYRGPHASNKITL